MEILLSSWGFLSLLFLFFFIQQTKFTSTSSSRYRQRYRSSTIRIFELSNSIIISQRNLSLSSIHRIIPSSSSLSTITAYTSTMAYKSE